MPYIIVYAYIKFTEYLNNLKKKIKFITIFKNNLPSDLNMVVIICSKIFLEVETRYDVIFYYVIEKQAK